MPSPTKIEFTTQLAYGADYPTPAFSPLPNAQAKNMSGERPIPHNVGDKLYVTRARYGLAYVAKAELKPNDIVLLPAYHCPAMVEPFMWAGCKIRFYKICADLQPDMKHFQALLEEARAVVLVRYFGFECNTRMFASIAEKHNCLVIEDLAHAAFIGEIFGHYGVTSLPKFYPLDRGAEIYVRRGWNANATRSTIDVYQKPLINWWLSAIQRKLRNFFHFATSTPNKGQTTYRYFNLNDLTRPVDEKSLRKALKCNSEEIIEKRRKNYHVIHQIMMQSSLGKPLFRDMTSDTIPYAYPFLLADSVHFHAIRRALVPLFRWEELAPSDCTTSRIYRENLIQIPCHQDLTDDDIALIASAAQTPTPLVHGDEL